MPHLNSIVRLMPLFALTAAPRAWAGTAPVAPAPVEPATPAAPLAEPAPVADPPVVVAPVPVMPPAPPVPPAPVPPASLPAPGTAAAVTSGKVGYDEGLYIATSDEEFRLKLGGWIIGRWGMASVADDVTQRFAVPGARITLSGNVFATTAFQLSLDVGAGTATLRDAYVDRPVLGTTLRFGQFKRPFSRQFIIARSRLQFTERALTNAWLGADRDVGASLFARPKPKAAGVEWAVAAFSGYGSALRASCDTGTPPTCGVPATSTADGKPTLVARLGWTSRMADSYEESDLDGGPLRFAIGAGYLVDLADGRRADMRHQAGLDLSLKANGASLAAAAYLVRGDDAAGARETTYGGHLQAGYMLVPRRVELAARFAQVPVADEALHEVLGVVNLFGHGHRQKWQAEGGITHLTDGDGVDWTLRLQSQIAF